MGEEDNMDNMARDTYQQFHPIVKEKAGSTKRSASLMCPPGMGKKATISPKEIYVAQRTQEIAQLKDIMGVDTIMQQQIEPMVIYPSSRPVQNEKSEHIGYK